MSMTPRGKTVMRLANAFTRECDLEYISTCAIVIGAIDSGCKGLEAALKRIGTTPQAVKEAIIAEFQPLPDPEGLQYYEAIPKGWAPNDI